jgi:uncharacterized membrane protein YqiK
MDSTTVINVGLYLGGFLAFLAIAYQALGVVIIGESEVGVVTKKISNKSLPPGRMIATNGEAGIQSETLSPGWHFGYWSVVFKVDKAPLTNIEPGQLGLVMAIDGNQITSNRILAKSVDCDNFQSAKAFLNNGGGSSSGGSGILDMFMATMIKDKMNEKKSSSPAATSTVLAAPDKA